MKLSILMITYNHGELIAQALESVLMQHVDFDFEIVIGEDCSTDNTREILLDYQGRFPDKIRLLLRPTNIGMMANFIETATACKGEYVAIVEGDDYWTSTDKLQKQVDFLDSHSGFSSVFHNVTVLSDGGEKICHDREMKEAYNLEDIVQGNFIHTCSVMYRNEVKFPEWFVSMPMGDWPLHVLNAQRGPIGYLADVMGCYRVHGTGVWSSRKKYDLIQATKRAALAINSHLDQKYSGIIKKKITLWDIESAKLMAKEGKTREGLGHIKAAIQRTPLYPKMYQRVIMQGIPSLLRSLFH